MIGAPMGLEWPETKKGEEIKISSPFSTRSAPGGFRLHRDRQAWSGTDGPCRARTYDPMIKSHLLYQLS